VKLTPAACVWGLTGILWIIGAFTSVRSDPRLIEFQIGLLMIGIAGLCLKK
jgi:hypothetical protein